jgi:hypothetical protein
MMINLTEQDEVVGVVEINANITRQMVDDILCTAFEGGINYWHHNKVKLLDDDFKGVDFASDALSRGAIIILTPDEPPYDGEVGEGFELNLDKFVNGMKLACNHYGMSPESLYDNHDASSADVIIQFALWDEVVFG